MSLLSANANRLGCICGAWIGVSAGVAAWLGTCAALNDGVLTVETTFQVRSDPSSLSLLY